MQETLSLFRRTLVKPVKIVVIFASIGLLTVMPSYAQDTRTTNLCEHHQGDVLRTRVFEYLANGEIPTLIDYMNDVFEISKIDPDEYFWKYENFLANAYTSCESVGAGGTVTKFSVDRICSGHFDCAFVVLHSVSSNGKDGLLGIRLYSNFDAVLSESGYTKDDFIFTIED